MTEDTFCTFCVYIASKYHERGRATLEGREEDFVRKDDALKKMIKKFRQELKDEIRDQP